MPYGAMEVIGEGWRYDGYLKRYCHSDGTCITYEFIESELERWREHNKMAVPVYYIKAGGDERTAAIMMMFPDARDIAPTKKQIAMTLNNIKRQISDEQ